MTKVGKDLLQSAIEVREMLDEMIYNMTDVAMMNVYSCEGKETYKDARPGKVKTSKQDLEILKYRLKTLLKDNILDVSFTKVDGTLRNMKCTLKPTLLPDSAFLTADERERSYTVSEDVLPVWDVEKNAWRSFRIDSVHDYIVTRKE